MARRILNRKGLRSDYEAAERKKKDEVDEEEDEEEAEEKGEDEESGEDEEDEAEGEAEEKDKDEADEDGEPEERASKKKKKPARAKSRSRTAKVVRMKVVWGVFNNSNQRVASYEYPRRKDADDHAAKLTADKKSTHFVQGVKEPIEEKKA